MAKNAYVNVRVEEDVKVKAEQILNELGINTSTAIDIFLKQIILKDGLPFDVRIPKIDFEKSEIELLQAARITDRIIYPKWFYKIVSLYAHRDIDLNVALYAINKGFSDEE